MLQFRAPKLQLMCTHSFRCRNFAKASFHVKALQCDHFHSQLYFAWHCACFVDFITCCSHNPFCFCLVSALIWMPTFLWTLKKKTPAISVQSFTLTAVKCCLTEKCYVIGSRKSSITEKKYQLAQGTTVRKQKKFFLMHLQTVGQHTDMCKGEIDGCPRKNYKLKHCTLQLAHSRPLPRRTHLVNLTMTPRKCTIAPSYNEMTSSYKLSFSQPAVCKKTNTPTGGNALQYFHDVAAFRHHCFQMRASRQMTWLLIAQINEPTSIYVLLNSIELTISTCIKTGASGKRHQDGVTITYTFHLLPLETCANGRRYQ